MTNGDIKTGAPVDVGLPNNEELLQLEQDILISPNILESGLSTLIRRYVYTKTEEDAYLTPDCVIESGEEDMLGLTVFAGYTQSDYHRKVIYQKDATSGEVSEWIIFSRFPNTTITDGSGRALETGGDRKYVRSILETMGDNYEREAIKKADSFDIKQHLIETLDGNIAEKEAELASYRRQLARVQEQDTPFESFRVTIKSGWADKGEESLNEVIDAVSLSDSLQKATAKFKEINHRGDVQASSFSVAISVGEDRFCAIPEEVVLPLFGSLATYDSEELEIKRAKLDLRNLSSK